MIKITSPSFAAGSELPAEFTCDGENVSPPLAWENVSGQAKSLVLILEDPDSSGGIFAHWVVFNIPPSVKGFARAMRRGSLPAGTIEGSNSFGKTGYGGPCPPRGKPHHYHFRIYAVDMPASTSRVSRTEILRAIGGHILDEGDLMALYQRK